jgi:FAD/FMN-containing dehydrogenase
MEGSDMATMVTDGRIDELELDELGAAFRGALIGPDDSSYDAARRVYNGAVDRRPALIARPVDTGDVGAAVRFGRRLGLPIAVRGGGHHGAGFGTCDDGLVIDLGELKGIRVDPAAQTARVEPGCMLADVDHATHAFGLALPTGIFGTTGIAGLTLGGGVGYLSRRYGLTVDSLIEADVVLASGELVTTDVNRHPDLFWAIRGGGGNFGIVTSFLFRLQPVSMIVGGPVFYDIDRAAEVLRWYRDFIVTAPRELSAFFGFATVPAGPPFPEHLHGRRVATIVWCYTGSIEESDAIFEPIKAIGDPLLFGVQQMPFPALQSAFDPLFPPGLAWQWRADFVTAIPDEAVDVHARFGASAPSEQSTMHLYSIDGAVHDVDSGDTAFSYRDVNWVMVIVAMDEDTSKAPALREWATAYWEALRPYSAGGGYVNMYMEEGQDRIRRSYRHNYDRLVQVKRLYDPDNVFRINQNIRPD